MPNLQDDLLANPQNPRFITPENFSALRRSLTTFGDLSGVVKCVRSGFLLGGHQRAAIMSEDSGAQVVITQRYARPTATGTVAEGYVESHGERFSFREVDWDAQKERLANIAANSPIARFDEEMLSVWLGELADADADLSLTLLDDELLSCLLPEEVPELEAPDEAQMHQPQADSPAPPPAARPEPATEPAPPPPPGTQLKQVQLVYTARDHAEFMRMVGVIQTRYGHQNASEAVMEALQQISEASP